MRVSPEGPVPTRRWGAVTEHGRNQSHGRASPGGVLSGGTFPGGTWHDSAARDGAALSGDQAELRARVTASVHWPRRACPAAVPSDTRWPPTTRMGGPARRTAPGCAAPAQRAGDLAAWNAVLPAEPVGFRLRLLLAEGGWPAQRPSRGVQDAAEGGRTGVCRRSGHRQGSRSSPRSAGPRACSPNVPATITTSSNWSCPGQGPDHPRADAGRPVPRQPPITADPRAAPPCPRADPATLSCRARHCGRFHRHAHLRVTPRGGPSSYRPRERSTQTRRALPGAGPGHGDWPRR